MGSCDLSPVVVAALERGFTVEQAIEAESIVGSNIEMALTYLLQTYGGF
jgi:hypothetical protein